MLGSGDFDHLPTGRNEALPGCLDEFVCASPSGTAMVDDGRFARRHSSPLVLATAVLRVGLIRDDPPRICHEGFSVLYTKSDRKNFLGLSRAIAPETLDIMHHFKKKALCL
jgi:hypothetical protein